MKVGALLLGTMIVGSPPAQAACRDGDFEAPIFPEHGAAISPDAEFRFRFSTQLNQQTFQLFHPASNETHQLVPVDEDGFVLKAPGSVPPGAVELQRRFGFCPECSPEVFGTFDVDEDISLDEPERPALRSAFEVTHPPDLAFCEDQFAQFSDDGEFNVAPRRWVRVNLLPPDDVSVRADVVAHLSDPDTGLDRIVRATSPTVEMRDGTAIAFPVGAFEQEVGLDIEVRYVDLTGQPGPPAEVHTSLAPSPPSCPAAGCGSGLNQPGSPFSCGPEVVSGQPVQRGGGAPPPSLGLLLIPWFLRKKR